MSEDKKQEKKGLSPNEARTYALSLLGYPQAEIGRIENITDRQVRYRIAKAKREMGLQNVQADAVLGVYKLVPKAIKVMENYLDGKGRSDGGDLKVATKLLESVGVLQGKGSSSIKIEQNNSVDVNTTINEAEHLTVEEIKTEIKASSQRLLNYINDPLNDENYESKLKIQVEAE